MIGPDRLLSPIAYALAGSRADQTQIVVEHLRQGVTRYAASRIHQTTSVDNTRVWVWAAVGKAVGQVSGNRLDRESLAALVEGATLSAHRQVPDPAFHSFAVPEERPLSVRGYDPVTAELGAEERADAIHIILDHVAERGWTASGTYLSEGREVAVANSHGLSAYAPTSRAFLRALPDSGHGTGYAAAWSHRFTDLDPASVATSAIRRCTLNHHQQEIEPGDYETIFDDLCVAEALLYLARFGFSGKTYEEGTSFMSGRLEQQVTGSNVTIWDDATDARGLATPVDYEGVPKRRVPLIEQGEARGVVYDSYTAHRFGKRSTGHAINPEHRVEGPMPYNLFMSGGQSSLEEMIRSVRRGLLVTRFHYTHGPDRQRVVMTGTTRDGTFLIENGEIVSAVKNLRLTQSIPDLFQGIEMMGQPRLCQDWWCSNGMGDLSYVCPPIKVNRAVFSSGTLF